MEIFATEVKFGFMEIKLGFYKTDFLKCFETLKIWLYMDILTLIKIFHEVSLLFFLFFGCNQQVKLEKTLFNIYFIIDKFNVYN